MYKEGKYYLGLVLRFCEKIKDVDGDYEYFNTQVLLQEYPLNVDKNVIIKHIYKELLAGSDTDFKHYLSDFYNVVNYELTLEPVYITESEKGIDLKYFKYGVNVVTKNFNGYVKVIEFMNNTISKELFSNIELGFGKSDLSYVSKLEQNKLHNFNILSEGLLFTKNNISNVFTNNVVAIDSWRNAYGYSADCKPFEIVPHFEEFNVSEFEKIRLESYELFKLFYDMYDEYVKNLIR